MPAKHEQTQSTAANPRPQMVQPNPNTSSGGSLVAPVRLVPANKK